LAEPRQTPTPRKSSTVFDRLKIGLTRVKLGEKKNAKFFDRLLKKRTAWYSPGFNRAKPGSKKERAQSERRTRRHGMHG